MKASFLSIFCLATALGLWFVQTASAQYVTLTAGPGKTSSATLTLDTNQLATVVYLSANATFSPGANGSGLEVVSGGVTCDWSMPALNAAIPPIIAGPATLKALYVSGSTPCVCTVQITQPTSTFVPVNTVVIPNDSGGPVQIILESSTDMIKWSATSPGTYGTSSSDRFFRVRASR